MGSVNHLEIGFEDEPLFDPLILQNLDWQGSREKFKPEISPKNPGENFKMRPLHVSDYNKGFLELLSQLTKVGEQDENKFSESFARMKLCKGMYYVIVIEDETLGQIVGATTLLVEQKFIHSCALKGYVEDVIVSENYRGKQLGKLLIETTTQLARELGLYKLVLSCRDQMIKFYESSGYCCEKANSNFMVMRFRD